MIPALLSIEDAIRAAGMDPGVEPPPAPPEYVGPSLIPAPAPDFRLRLASALDGAPAYSGARPGESAASAGLRGLLSGASGGFVASQEKRAKVDEANRVQSNTASRTAADRAYANAQATWREKLTRYYRTESDNAGKVMLTPKMAEDMGIPFEAGRKVDPVEASKAITARRNSMKVPNVTGKGSSGVFGQPGEDDTANQIALAIERGDQPPDMKGLYRYGGPVRAILGRRGYDFTAANQDWQAVQRWISTANGPQQNRMRQAAQTAYESLDVIDQLSAQLSKEVPRGAIKVLNRASLVAAQNGAFGPAAQSTATLLAAQITDVTSELGNVYMGGNSPTDHALQLAGKNLSADWTEKQLRDATNLARTNLRIRLNSMRFAQPVSPGTGGGAVEEWVRDPATGKLVKKGG